MYDEQLSKGFAQGRYTLPQPITSEEDEFRTWTLPLQGVRHK